jgi:hypothetical protein
MSVDPRAPHCAGARHAGRRRSGARRLRRCLRLLGEHEHGHDRARQPRRQRREPELHHRRHRPGRSRGRRDERLLDEHRGNSLGRANVLDGSGVDNNFGSLSPLVAPLGMAVDSTHLYWTFLGVIGRYDLTAGTAQRVLIQIGDDVEGVAVDGAHIYRTDRTNGTVGRADLADGGNADPSFITEASSPVGVAVDANHIYWANTGTAGGDRAQPAGQARGRAAKARRRALRRGLRQPWRLHQRGRGPNRKEARDRLCRSAHHRCHGCARCPGLWLELRPDGTLP